MGLAGVQEEGEEFEFEVALPEDAALKRHEPKKSLFHPRRMGAAIYVVTQTSPLPSPASAIRPTLFSANSAGFASKQKNRNS